MKILFYFKQYESSTHRGIGRYICSLLDYMLKNYPEIEISIIKDRESKNPIFNYGTVKYYYFDKLDDYDFEDKFDFLIYDNLNMPNFDNPNSFFYDMFPNKILESCKRITTVGYDLIGIVSTAYSNMVKSNDYDLYLIASELYYVCEHIFVISEHTKKDFIKYLNIDESKLTNIYGGADGKFRNANNEDNYSYKTRENHIVFISDCTDWRKNIKKLIEAFSIAYNQNKIPVDSKLYICGKIDNVNIEILNSKIKECGLTNKQIILTNYISDEELMKLISYSKANFLPSLYEGLGLSILEAYACGTPSFASNVSSTKELVLDECSFDPYDEKDIANAIEKAFNSEELCKKSVEFGKKLLEEKCNWDLASKKVVEKLKELNKNVVIDKAFFMEYLNYKCCHYSNSHIFASIKNYNDFEYINNSLIARYYNNDFIPLEYYNKFLDKYEYNKKIFVLGTRRILEYAIKEKDKNNSYLLLINDKIFDIIFDYLENSLIDFKKLIKEYYFDFYKSVKDINDTKQIFNFFNLLKQNKIYGFSILFNMTNIRNIITNNENINDLILSEREYFKKNLKFNNEKEINLIKYDLFNI